MVTFSSRVPGTPEAAWAKSARLRALPALHLGDVERVVVISAHPDDEALGAAGLISRLASQNIPVTFIAATNGEASHPDSPTHSAIEMRRRRRAELKGATTIMAPGSSVTFLGFPDGRLAEYILELGEAIGGAIGDCSNALVLAPWLEDRHPDHRAAALAARKAAQQKSVTVLEYPVWFWHWADPNEVTVPWPLMRRHELTKAERGIKSEALQQYPSQITPLSSQPGDEAVIDPPYLQYFLRDFEVFVVAGPDRE